MANTETHALTIRDITELTKHVNRLESLQNQLSEENEALRDRVGLGAEDSVNLSQLRAKRNEEREGLRAMNRMLQNEVGGAACYVFLKAVRFSVSVSCLSMPVRGLQEL